MFAAGQLVSWWRKALDAVPRCIIAVVEEVEAERIVVRFVGQDGLYWRRVEPQKLFMIPEGVEVDPVKISQLFPSKFVKATDLNGKTVTLTIAKLVVEEMGHGAEKERKPVLYFQKTTKGLVLNRTNSLTIAGLYGDESDDWVGKRIAIYPTRVKAFGAMQDTIRVREEIPAQPKPVATAPETTEEHAGIDDDEDVADAEIPY